MRFSPASPAPPAPTAAATPASLSPDADAQSVRSNMVACRLKIGGAAQAAAAIQDARQCIDMNPSWAKGHVRLASAYVALGGRSNDACNSLQTAIGLDPSNQLARQMLVRELRRDHAVSASSPQEQGGYLGLHDDNTGSPQRQRNRQEEYENPYQQVPVDEDSVSWTDRFNFHASRLKSWYQMQNDQFKIALRAIVVVLVLYIAFGGRFGLDSVFHSGPPAKRGNYGAGNAYDQYYRQGYSGGSTSKSHQNDYYSTAPQHPQRTSSSSSFQFPNLLDGSLPSMALLAGLAYVGHRNGITPLQALMFVNMLGGGRRRGFGGFGGFNMGGMGGGGYGGRGMGWGGRGWGRGRPRW